MAVAELRPAIYFAAAGPARPLPSAQLRPVELKSWGLERMPVCTNQRCRLKALSSQVFWRRTKGPSSHVNSHVCRVIQAATRQAVERSVERLRSTGRKKLTMLLIGMVSHDKKPLVPNNRAVDSLFFLLDLDFTVSGIACRQAWDREEQHWKCAVERCSLQCCTVPTRSWPCHLGIQKSWSLCFHGY